MRAHHKQDAYVDASVLLAILFCEEVALDDLMEYRDLYSSKIIQTEALRTCHRVRIQEKYSDEQFAEILFNLQTLLLDFNLIPVTDSILEAASRSFPTIIGTLDAIHLTTAVLLKNQKHIDTIILTHDRQLQIAAQAVGFGVRG